MPRIIATALNALVLLAVLAVGLFVLSLMFPGAAKAQEAGCYQIDRFGQLCIPGTGEIFVEEAHGEYAWINDGNYKDAFGMHCCGIADCTEINPADVSEKADGFHYQNRLVNKRGTYNSRDGKAWICRYDKCLFLPGSG